LTLTSPILLQANVMWSKGIMAKVLSGECWHARKIERDNLHSHSRSLLRGHPSNWEHAKTA